MKKIWFWANTKRNIGLKRKNIKRAIMVGWRINVLISTVVSLAAATSDVSFSRISPPGSNKLLSRKRRFFIPQTQGWALRWVIDTRSIISKMSFYLSKYFFIKYAFIKIKVIPLFISRGIFDTIIPVEGGAGGPILLRLPITYSIDTGT